MCNESPAYHSQERSLQHRTRLQADPYVYISIRSSLNIGRSPCIPSQVPSLHIISKGLGVASTPHAAPRHTDSIKFSFLGYVVLWSVVEAQLLPGQDTPQRLKPDEALTAVNLGLQVTLVLIICCVVDISAPTGPMRIFGIKVSDFIAKATRSAPRGERPIVTSLAPGGIWAARFK